MPHEQIYRIERLEKQLANLIGRRRNSDAMRLRPPAASPERQKRARHMIVAGRQIQAFPVRIVQQGERVRQVFARDAGGIFYYNIRFRNAHANQAALHLRRLADRQTARLSAAGDDLSVRMSPVPARRALAAPPQLFPAPFAFGPHAQQNQRFPRHTFSPRCHYFLVFHSKFETSIDTSSVFVYD